MTVDHSCVEPIPHRCYPPHDGLPWISTHEPRGTRFFCDCGQVWIVRHVPARSYGSCRVLDYNSWFRESREEWRRRHGLPWWAWLTPPAFTGSVWSKTPTHEGKKQ